MKKTAASDETTASDCRQTLDKNEVCLFSLQNLVTITENILHKE